MDSLLRPIRQVGLIAAAAVAAVLLLPCEASAQAHQLSALIESGGLLAARSANGYLGIDCADVTPAKVAELKLANAHGAVITLIDHDAPAGQAGLKVNDVVLQVNGQQIAGAEQLRHLLKQLAPGSQVTMQISRAGVVHSIQAKLVDRQSMEKRIWNRLTSFGDIPEMGLFSGGSMPSGFHLPSFGSTLKVGVLVEPLTSQMAAYLGVPSGLMIKQVARKSPAETAGLQAFDVILKVGDDSVATSADWDRALRSNQGHPVQLLILRNKKQQTVMLNVATKAHAK